MSENGSYPLNKEAIDIAIDVITMLPPTDHQFVINGGKTGKGGASKELKTSRDTTGSILTGDHWQCGNMLRSEPIHKGL